MKAETSILRFAKSGKPSKEIRTQLFAILTSLLVSAHSAVATDLMEVWHAAEIHDLDYNAARSGHQAGVQQAAQASALWRPQVQLSGTLGRMSSETLTEGAQFSAPPLFPATQGVSFNTHINNGTVERFALSAKQPLINQDRQIQSRQLNLGAGMSELEWQSARQSLILRSTELYFDVVMAEETLAVLRRQSSSIEKTLEEIKSRFQLGELPITDTHEATARLESIQAQLLSAESDLQLKLFALADTTGLPAEKLTVMQPVGEIPFPNKKLDDYLLEASQNNLELRIKQTQVELAREEAKRHDVMGSSSLDLIGEISHDHLSGSGNFGAASNTNRNAIFGVQFNLPLYTGGYRNSKKGESIALAEKSLLEYDRMRQKISLKTRATWLGLTVGSSRLNALVAAQKAVEERLAATRLGHKVGDRTTLDILNAENDAATAHLAWMQAKITLEMDSLRLFAHTGKLDEEQVQTINATLQHADIGRNNGLNIFRTKSNQ